MLTRPPIHLGTLTNAFTNEGQTHMQAPTHILTGILIQKAVRPIKSRSVRTGAIVALGATSHLLLDKFARLTYHPADAMPRDGFWLAHYTLTMTSAGVLVGKHRRDYKTAMLAAVIPDFDWVLVWGLKLLPFRRKQPDMPILHAYGDRMIEKIPAVRSLRRLPDWKLVRWSTALEVLLCGVLARRIWPRKRRSTAAQA
ncbi:MAG: hypothetical protein H0T53_12345 [Herpetosiphonaceae bacterium]|nr:hypothetical protein [Herpetosiphonaceae bacterium]